MNKTDKPIIVKDGHLWRDGVKLKLEFGNLEQIEAIRKHEKKIQSFIDGEVEPDCSYTVRGIAGFECICGKLMLTETDADHENDIECFERLGKKCNSCNRNYEFILDRDYRYMNGRLVCVNEELKVKLCNEKSS